MMAVRIAIPVFAAVIAVGAIWAVAFSVMPAGF
jgi:hypothetical protein